MTVEEVIAELQSLVDAGISQLTDEVVFINPAMQDYDSIAIVDAQNPGFVRFMARTED